jgi:hypothetical protein
MTLRHTRAAVANLLLGLTLGTVVASALAGATGTGAAASSAAVQDGPRLERFRAACNHEIDRRMFILAVADDWISTARRLSDDERAAMLASNASVRDHLQDVNRPAVAAATDRDALAAACQAIFTDNRVYVVVIPQLMLTIRSTQIADALEALDGLAADKAAEGHDTTEVEGWLAEAAAHLEAAVAAGTSVTVDSYNADPESARAAFDTASAENAAAWDLAVRSFLTLVNM